MFQGLPWFEMSAPRSTAAVDSAASPLLKPDCEGIFKDVALDAPPKPDRADILLEAELTPLDAPRMPDRGLILIVVGSARPELEAGFMDEALMEPELDVVGHDVALTEPELDVTFRDEPPVEPERDVIFNDDAPTRFERDRAPVDKAFIDPSPNRSSEPDLVSLSSSDTTTLCVELFLPTCIGVSASPNVLILLRQH